MKSMKRTLLICVLSDDISTFQEDPLDSRRGSLHGKYELIGASSATLRLAYRGNYLMGFPEWFILWPDSAS